MKGSGLLAVRCFGWIHLTRAQMQQAAFFAPSAALSAWAIVKELSSEPTEAHHLDHMLAAIDSLYNSGVVLDELCLKDYRGGLLMNLGASRTFPHPVWSEYDAEFKRHSNKALLLEWARLAS